jgi:hypothetical protein
MICSGAIGAAGGGSDGMPYALLADVVVVVHVLFVVFAVAGGLAVVRWPRLAFFHVPCALWAVLVALAGWICPLTPLENWLRERAGDPTYETTFIEHYVLPILYPSALTRGAQVGLGVVVLTVNVAAYTWVWRRVAARGRK